MTGILTSMALKHWKEILLAIILIFTSILILIFGAAEEETVPYEGGGAANVSPLVLRYQPLVEKYAAKYGVESYVQVLLAKMMQETGGRLPDVMQSSESLGLPMNTIQDPERSIDVGIKYFAEIHKKTKNDLKLTLQSYNFGIGFIDYALDRGGYSKSVAIEFSNMMAKKMHWERYGDVNYVENVMRYLSGPATPVSSFGFAKPVNGKITSPFGMRIHPITGIPKMHEGIDFGCNRSPIPIKSTKSGVVTKSGWQSPNHNVGYGQRVYVDHGGGVTSVYAHLSSIGVKVGQKIDQGQSIGKCGTTGGSTGMHLHFEIHLKGKKVDPAKYVN